MKYLVIADTHSNIENVEGVLRLVREKIDGILHAGDGIRDFAYVKNLKIPQVFAARGNIDSVTHIPYLAVFEIMNIKLALTHGHLFSIETIIDEMVALGKQEQASLVVFGHTHIPFHKKKENIELVNPGSLGKPRGFWGPSFALLEITDDSSIDVRYFELIKEGREFSYNEFSPL